MYVHVVLAGCRRLRTARLLMLLLLNLESAVHWQYLTTAPFFELYIAIHNHVALLSCKPLSPQRLLRQPAEAMLLTAAT